MPLGGAAFASNGRIPWFSDLNPHFYSTIPAQGQSRSQGPQRMDLKRVNLCSKETEGFNSKIWIKLKKNKQEESYSKLTTSISPMTNLLIDSISALWLKIKQQKIWPWWVDSRVSCCLPSQRWFESHLELHLVFYLIFLWERTLNSSFYIFINIKHTWFLNYIEELKRQHWES